MKPVKFKEQNTVFGATGCGNLPAHKYKDGIVSCWKGTIAERLKFLLIGKMWISIIGGSQPPIWAGTQTPFSGEMKE